jgi:hypothetical protein
VTLEPVLSEAEGSALYAAPLASSGYHVCRYYVAEWGRFPFGPACYSRFAGSNSRRLRAFVEHPVHRATRSKRHRPRLAVYLLSPLALRRLRAILPP